MFRVHHLTILTTAILFGIWCLLTYGGIVSPLFLPSPSAVVLELVDLYREGLLIKYTWDSVYRVTVGFLLAAVTAVPLGLVLGRSRIVEAITQPFIEFVRYLPVVALVPLTILYLGIGDIQKVAVIFLGTFFQLVLMIADVSASVPRDFIRASATLGANTYQVYRYVIIPCSLPGIMDNLRITIGWAWTYLVVAELVAANSGLGFMILRSQRFLQTDRIFAGLLIIGLLGVLTDWLFRKLTKLVVPWSEKAGGKS
ncbi:MAG: Binding-protein-dependent transport systems inner membrane component [Thermoanaerobacterales bacterium 50_218]|nr:MAG: Binding-protein-dependent transport systems inner membrane component [Thermoanaerobacterales bacterium 50_218]HAA90518.1 ABC transporter permease [Peptococcaceae bacterium]